MDLQGKLEDGFEHFQSLDTFRKASPIILCIWVVTVSCGRIKFGSLLEHCNN